MLSFIVLLVIGFIASSFMYSYFAHHAMPEPMEHRESAEVVIIGKKTNANAKAA